MLLALASSGCLTEPGVDDSGSTDTDPVTEVLGFDEAPTNVGFRVSVLPGEGASALGGGAALSDLDGDGYDEVLVLGREHSSRLFKNQADGTFTKDSSLPPLDGAAMGAAFADVDGDRHPDLLIPSALDGSVAVYLNPEGKGFSDKPFAAGFEPNPAPAQGIVTADLDADGDLDAYVVRWAGATTDPDEPTTGLLWVNDGKGHFSDATEALPQPEAERRVSMALPVDHDNDGKVDLVLARGTASTLVLQNQSKDGKLKFATREIDVNAWGLDSGDLSRDGKPDLLLYGVDSLETRANAATNGQGSGPEDGGVVQSAADGGLDPSSSDAGPSDAAPLGFGAYSLNRVVIGDKLTVWNAPTLRHGSGAACVADFNNDGLLDVFQATLPADDSSSSSADLGTEADAGVAAKTAHLFLQRAGAAGEFVQVADLAGLDDAGEGRAVLCSDYDLDGDVDVFVVPFEGPARLYQNTLDPALGPANYVNVILVGSKDHPNVVGARVNVVTNEWSQTRVVGENSVSGAQGSAALHFGLSTFTSVDGMFITWPDYTDETVIEDLAVNSTHTVRRR
jgi:hypothetical protein